MEPCVPLLTGSECGRPCGGTTSGPFPLSGVHHWCNEFDRFGPRISPWTARRQWSVCCALGSHGVTVAFICRRVYVGRGPRTVRGAGAGGSTASGKGPHAGVIGAGWRRRTWVSYGKGPQGRYSRCVLVAIRSWRRGRREVHGAGARRRGSRDDVSWLWVARGVEGVVGVCPCMVRKMALGRTEGLQSMGMVLIPGATARDMTASAGSQRDREG